MDHVGELARKSAVLGTYLTTNPPITNHHLPMDRRDQSKWGLGAIRRE